MAAEKALFQTKYKFTKIPSTLANAEWNRRTDFSSISDSDDNNNETPGMQHKNMIYSLWKPF